jgi:uncharacterized protein (TIGR02147 family)
MHAKKFMYYKEVELFEYRDYKAFLNETGKIRPRGFRTALAEAAPCQMAYVTHVLGGGAHFTLDQADGISRYLGHTKLEHRYFLALVEHGRAGTPQLRHSLEELLQEYRDRFFSLKERVGIKESLTREDQLTYYSSWLFAAVHVMTSIPALQTRNALARALAVPLKKINEVVDFLLLAKLVEERGARLHMTARQIHLERESPLISKHHSNWRMQAIQSLDREGVHDVHYSSVFTLTSEAAERVQAVLTQAIADSVQVIKDAKEEKTCALTLDFFSID